MTFMRLLLGIGFAVYIFSCPAYAVDDIDTSDPLPTVEGVEVKPGYEAVQVGLHFMKLEKATPQKHDDIVITMTPLGGTPFDTSPDGRVSVLSFKAGSLQWDNNSALQKGFIPAEFVVKNNSSHLIQIKDDVITAAKWGNDDWGLLPGDYLASWATIGTPAFTKTALHGLEIYPGEEKRFIIGIRAPFEQTGRDNYGNATGKYIGLASKQFNAPLTISFFNFPVKYAEDGSVSKRANFTWKLNHCVYSYIATRKKINTGLKFLNAFAPIIDEEYKSEKFIGSKTL